MPQISVIVPVYNAETSLAKCIDSIIAQTYTDWELIIIDDGSLDNSGELCDIYAKQDTRIRVFHQENAGPSIARNNGLNQAKGKFVIFVDADDWIENNHLADYMAEDDTYDLIFQGYILEKENTRTTIEGIELDSKQTSITDIIINLWRRDLFGYTWLKRFKRSIIEEHHIRFDAQVRFREDTIFTAEYCVFAKSIKSCKLANYHYSFSALSLSHSNLIMEQILYVNEKIYKAFSLYFNDLFFKEFTEYWYIQDMQNVARKSKNFSDDDRNALITKAILHRKDYPHFSFIHAKRKCMNLLIEYIWKTKNVWIISKFLFVFRRW